MSTFNNIAFISYSHLQNDFAEQVQEILSQIGVDSHLAHRDINKFANYKQEIEKQLNQSDALIIIYTEEWIKSRECEQEFRSAVAKGKKLLPLIHDKITVDYAKYPELGGINHIVINLDGPNEDLDIQLSNAFLISLSQVEEIFKGLHNFEAEDQCIYFGREKELIETLGFIKNLTPDKNIAIKITGASGSGKSSFLRAGIFASLSRESKFFKLIPVIDCRKLDFKIHLDQIQTNLQENNNKRIVIFLDQAEQLIEDNNIGAIKLLDAIANLIKEHRSSITIIFGVRGDKSDLLDEIELLRNLEVKTIPLDKLHRNNYRKIMSGPISYAKNRLHKKIEMPEDTKDEIINFIGNKSDPLPILSLILYNLYSDQKSQELIFLEITATNEKRYFTDIINDQITKASEEFNKYHETPEILEWLYPRICKWDQSGEISGIKSVDYSIITNKSIKGFVEKMIDHRLMRRQKNDVGKVEVEVVHESVLKIWEQFRNWHKKNKGNLQLAEVLLIQAEQWKRNSSSPLLNKSKIADATKIDRNQVLAYGYTIEQSSRIISYISASKNKIIKTKLAVFSIAISILLPSYLLYRQKENLSIIAETLINTGKISTLRNNGNIDLFHSISSIYISFISPAKENLLKVASANLSMIPMELLGWGIKFNGSTSSIDINQKSQQALASSKSGEIAIFKLPERTLLQKKIMGQEIVAAYYLTNNQLFYVSKNNFFTKITDHLDEISAPQKIHSTCSNSDITFSKPDPYHRYLEVSYADGSIAIFNLSTLEQINCITNTNAHDQQAFRADFSSDGNLLVTSSRLNNDTKPGDGPDSSIKYWKVPSLQKIPNPHKISESHPACSKWVYDIAANTHSSNDRFFAACSTNGAREYNQKFDYLPGRKSGRVTSALAVSPVDYVLAVGTAELTIELWSICADDSPSTCSSELLRELKGHSSEITNLKFSRDGNMLISGDQDGHVLVWDMKRTALSPTPPSMAYSAISSDGCESVQKPPLGSRAMLYLPKHEIWVTSVLSDESSHGSIQLWDKNFKQIIPKFKCFSDKPAPTPNAPKEPIGPIESMAFDAEEKYLFIGRYSNSSSGCRTEIDSLIRGEPFSCEKIIGKGRVWSIKSSNIAPEIIFGNLQSSAYFINSQRSSQAHVIDRQEFKGTISIDRHPKHLNQIAFGGYRGSVTLTDSISNPTYSTELLAQQERTTVIRNIKYRPDGKILAAIGEGKKLFLWDIGHIDKHEKYQFEDSLISMAFSPDSKSILIGTSNGHLHFFDMENKTSTPILTNSDGINLNNRGPIWSIVFDPNNSAFIYAGEHKKFDATGTAYTYYGSMPYYTDADAIRRRICNYLGSASGEAGIDCSSFSASATP